MTLPNFFGQDVDKADALIDRTLVERIRRQIAVKVPGAQVGNHLWWGHNADLDVDIRVQTKFGDVIAQQEVVHRIFERHPKGEAFPLLRITLVEVFVGQNNRLTVDVFNGWHDVGLCNGSRPQGHCQWHRRQHVGGVVFTRQRFITGHGPSSGFDHLSIQTVAGIKAQRFCHDDGCGAGNRHKADVQVSLFGRAEIVEDRSLGRVQWKD